MVKKIMRSFVRWLRLRPADTRVLAIANTLPTYVSEAYEKNTMLIAVQGLPDPIFFGLFSSIVEDLRKNQSIRAELLQIRSINGAIGVDAISKLHRSWLNTYLFNNQWARIYRNLIGSVAYRSQPFFWNFFRGKDRRLARQLWNEMKALPNPERLYTQGIQIGDLVIDSYLRFRPSPRFDVNDPFVLMILQQAVRELSLARHYFKMKLPSLYLSSYSTYIEHGIPVRVAVGLGIPVRVYGNLITFGKKLSARDTYHTVDTSQYKERFKALSAYEKNVALEFAEKELNHRLSGGIDVATSYMRVSAYAYSGERVPQVVGAVVIFLHDFYDSPHIYPDLVFTDFWAWICFTIKTLSDAGIPFWLKAHPNQISLGAGVLVELQQKFPQARFISPGITNTELVKAGILCGVTVYGTVAHELAYLGVPTITCANHPHASFDFCWTGKTVEEYRRMLLSPGKLPISIHDMRQQALAFYYMHNFSGPSIGHDLKVSYIAFWKACEACEEHNLDTNEITKALQELKSLPGWHTHILEILEDIKNYE